MSLNFNKFFIISFAFVYSFHLLQRKFTLFEVEQVELEQAGRRPAASLTLSLLLHLRKLHTDLLKIEQHRKNRILVNL